MSECSRHDHCCPITGITSSVHQTIDEIEFEKGLWYAAQTGDSERVAVLLRKGAAVNGEDAAGYVALHYAARHGHKGVCEQLLSVRANVDAVTRAGRATALHRACTAGT